MPDPNVRCVLVQVHGIGDQPQNWTASFDAALGQRLGVLTAAQQDRFRSVPVWWAKFSPPPGAGRAAGGVAGAGPSPAAGGDSELPSTPYDLVFDSYASQVATGDAAGGVAGFGIPDFGQVVAHLKGGAVSAADQANDIANYTLRNGVRAQILHELTKTLFDVSAEYPNAEIILGSHSQGTIVSYDVLRQVGSRLPQLKVWVTMGCPLGWYYNQGGWGRDLLSISATLTWLNWFDDQDKVGKALQGLVDWVAPRPQDRDVDNTGQNLHPHDHWANPTVVQGYADLILARL